MQLGTWFDGGAGARAIRRFALARAITHTAPGARTGGVRPLRALADASFWLGAREAATGPEWQRLTASSYVALLYHRMAGEGRPGEEKLDISPGRFASQMRLLRRLRFTALTAERLLAFHGDSAEALPARSVVMTVDDLSRLRGAVVGAPRPSPATVRLDTGGRRPGALDGETNP